MVVYFVFLVFTIYWLGIIFFIPYLASLYSNHSFVIACYSIFKIICHQIAKRSYFVFGHQMPVCVRCFGIYCGLLLGCLLYPLFKKINSTELPKFGYLKYSFAPIIIDGASQILNLYYSPLYVRFATGIIASVSIVFYVLPMLNQIYNRIRDK